MTSSDDTTHKYTHKHQHTEQRQRQRQRLRQRQRQKDRDIDTQTQTQTQKRVFKFKLQNMFCDCLCSSSYECTPNIFTSTNLQVQNTSCPQTTRAGLHILCTHQRFNAFFFYIYA